MPSARASLSLPWHTRLWCSSYVFFPTFFFLHLALQAFSLDEGWISIVASDCMHFFPYEQWVVSALVFTLSSLLSFS